MTAPAPKKNFRKKIAQTFVNRNEHVVPLHRWKLRAGICAPTNKKLRAYRGGAAAPETTRQRERKDGGYRSPPSQILLARYLMATTGHSGTLRMLVRTAGISHNRKMDASSSASQMT